MWPHVWDPHYVIKEHDTPAVPNLKRKEKKNKKRGTAGVPDNDSFS